MRTKPAPVTKSKSQFPVSCLGSTKLVCLYFSYSLILFGLAKVAYSIIGSFLELWVNRDR